MSVAEVQAGETGDLDAQLRERWRRLKDAGTAQPMPDHQLRRERLGRLRRLVLDNRADIIAAINADFGSRAAEETLVAEVFTTLSGIRHASAHLARWMRPRRRAVDLAFRPATARLLPQPLGVVGIISPWNYPLYLALSPLVAALAAGNRVMLKPSEVSPRTSELLARLLGRAFTTDEVDVVLGG
ncbi:MAG: aldehyde dehydrogenase family protein, partial [Alphaproteobacteria bacterium]|nr:aldehyde dehydrogenase family protein [Alphaproteobacteria bacterium]